MTLYEQWQSFVLRAYNLRFNNSCTLDDVDICEDGSVYEGNLSFASGFMSWQEWQDFPIN